MLEIGLLKFGHIICLVYWLGADLGVFYSSYFVADDRLARETRLSMAKLLFALDQAPRLCMPLIFGSGAHLAWRLGAWQVPGAAVAAVWIVCLAWLGMVVTLHATDKGKTLLTRVDFGFRLLVIAALVAYAINALRVDSLPAWLAVKIIIYAGLVACGLAIRVFLKPFGPAFGALAGGEATDADNAAIRGTFSRTRPFVIAIWIGLLVNTALGVHLL